MKISICSKKANFPLAKTGILILGRTPEKLLHPMKIVDVENWKRKEHFDFFSKMKNPFFGITTEVDCTHLYERSKEEGVSFFSCYLHSSMTAVNAVEELRYRIVEDKVVCFPVIDAGATVGREDGTFGFIYVPYHVDFQIFNAALQKEIQAVHRSTGLRLQDEDKKKNLIRHSTIPWTSFSALLHPTNLDPKESIPKITFGKYSTRGGKKFLPVSIEAHHGLLDGIHLAKYLHAFQEQLDR